MELGCVAFKTLIFCHYELRKHCCGEKVPTRPRKRDAMVTLTDISAMVLVVMSYETRAWGIFLKHCYSQVDIIMMRIPLSRHAETYPECFYKKNHLMEVNETIGERIMFPDILHYVETVLGLYWPQCRCLCMPKGVPWTSMPSTNMSRVLENRV